jgi:hypothetical protein
MSKPNSDNLSLAREMASQNAASSTSDNAPDACGKIPLWTWIFVIACWGLIFFAPGLIIVSAIASFVCTNVARDETKPMSVRFRNTVLVTLACWLLFAALFAVSLTRSAPAAPPKSAMPQKVTR